MNRYLLDTDVFLWWILNDSRLGRITSTIISDPNNEVYVSAASLWEMSIKEKLGKLKLPDVSMSGIVESEGFLPLSISLIHGEAAGSLPVYHKNPFDRMLVAQAQTEGLTVITKDEFIPKYNVQTVNALE